MSEHTVARCRSCQARIVWTTNVSSGRRMPVDADPVAGGNVVLVSGNDGPEARVLTKDELARRAPRLDGKPDLHVSHFATCAQAKDWRKP